MPIQFACPHCGKQTTVADEFAGQSGACSACGKPISIPFPSSGPGTPVKRSGGGGTVVVITILATTAVVLLLCGGVLLALLLPAVGAARMAAQRMQSGNNLKQLSVAVQNYLDVYQAFPPPVVKDPAGRPLYSGRVLLLPFMEQAGLYEAFDKDKAWDSPENKPISMTMIPAFNDPSRRTHPPGATDYVFVSGIGTAFDPTATVTYGDITDGTSNTLIFVEVKDSDFHWAEPRDIDFSQPNVTLDSNRPNIVMAAYLDGHVQPIQKSTSPEIVHALATRAGNEAVELP
jgi:hypothetical protein